MNKVETAWVFMTQTRRSHGITSTILNRSKWPTVKVRRHGLCLSIGESNNLKLCIIAISLSEPQGSFPSESYRDVNRPIYPSFSDKELGFYLLGLQGNQRTPLPRDAHVYTYTCISICTHRHGHAVRSGAHIEPTLPPSVAMYPVRETQSPALEFFTGKFKITDHSCSYWQEKRVLGGTESSH